MTQPTEVNHLNLCESLVLLMMAEGFKQSSIRTVTQDRLFQAALTQPIDKQRTVLITVLRKRFLMLEKQPPKAILLSLNLAHDAKAWLGDIRANVLQFLKANEDTYFPA